MSQRNKSVLNDMTITCEVCRSSEDYKAMVECVECSTWSHNSCLDPSLPKLPSKDESWVCEFCSGKKNKTPRIAQWKISTKKDGLVSAKKKSGSEISSQTALKKGSKISKSSNVQGDQEAVSALKNDLGRNEITMKLREPLVMILNKSATKESDDKNAEGTKSDAAETAEEETQTEVENIEEIIDQEIEEFQASKKRELEAEISLRKIEVDEEIEEFSRMKKKEAKMLKAMKILSEKLKEIKDMKAKTASLVERRDGMNHEIEKRVQERDEMNQEIEANNKLLQNLQDALKELESDDKV